MPIVINNLTKTFFPNKKIALKNVSIEFKSNQITGLIGFNGSGKTTIFNILSQCIETFDSGKFTFEGKALDLDTRKQISYLTDGQGRRDNQSAVKHLKIIANLYNADSKWSGDQILYYSDKFEFRQYLFYPIKSLSKGNKQKIKIIASFLNPNCKYMFLDEPFTGLDPVMVEIVKKEYLKLKNTTIIISSHLINILDTMVSEFYIIKNGTIVDFRKTENQTIIVRVNKEVLIKKIDKLSFVININKTNNYTDITISNKKYFAKLNKLLVVLPNYEYSTIIKKNVTMSVLEGYKNND